MLIESLNYPFDTKAILRKRRSIRKELSLQKDLKEIRVALLGGSTTSDILNFVEIFLLNAGLGLLSLNQNMENILKMLS
tara:strand:- start:59 stop:295 length:237 start_codon:yes stop_codon:yes gene_type:complete